MSLSLFPSLWEEAITGQDKPCDKQITNVMSQQNGHETCMSEMEQK